LISKMESSLMRLFFHIPHKVLTIQKHKNLLLRTADALLYTPYQ